MFFRRRRSAQETQLLQQASDVNICVVGVGGGGGNAVRRMAKNDPSGIRHIVLNTDIQALRGLDGIQTFAIGPEATGGLGSGGRPEVGRRAMRESQAQVATLMNGVDMVFVAAGMGGGTGTGASALVADLARKRGALTVGVVTLPFAFEGPRRRKTAQKGLAQLSQKVDTLIVVENDRLLPSMDGRATLEQAFIMADEVLRQGVQGISDIVKVGGMINVDFADVKAIMTNGGSAFMAVGEAVGRDAAIRAAQAALANPLFDAPIDDADGVLLNVKGGPDLTLGQVHEVAGIISKAASPNADVMFGVVQDRGMKKAVKITLVATGVHRGERSKPVEQVVPISSQVSQMPSVATTGPLSNGHLVQPITEMKPML